MEAANNAGPISRGINSSIVRGMHDLLATVERYGGASLTDPHNSDTHKEKMKYKELQHEAFLHNVYSVIELHEKAIRIAPRLNVLWHEALQNIRYDHSKNHTTDNSHFRSFWIEKGIGLQQRLRLDLLGIEGGSMEIINLSQGFSPMIIPNSLLDRGWLKAMRNLVNNFKRQLDSEE